MRALLVALALLLPGAAWAQGSPGIGGGVPCYAGFSCDLGTGALTARGGTLSNGAAGTSAKAALTLKNAAGIGFQFVPQIEAVAYNPLVSANDEAIISGGSGTTNVLTLAPWSTTKSGLRLLGDGHVYSANNTLDDGAGGALFKGSVSLTGSGTALSVSNSAVFGSGGSAPVTVGSVAGGSGISAPSLLNLNSEGGLDAVAMNSPGGIAAIFFGNAAVTGRLNVDAGQSNGPITFNSSNSPYQYTGFNYSLANATQQFVITNNISGNSYTAPAAASYNCGGISGFFVMCNNGDALATTGGNAPHSLDVYRFFGGAGTTGGRIVANFQLQDTSSTGTSDTTSQFYQALNVASNINSNLGGVSGTYRGDVFASGLYVTLGSQSTFIDGIALQEGDITVPTGASVHKVSGYTVILLSTNKVAGDIANTAFGIAAQSGATPTITCGYCFGSYDGVNAMAASASLFAFTPQGGVGSGPTVTNGWYFPTTTFTGDAYADGHFQLTGAGEFLQAKITDPNTAPGAGEMKLTVEAGTTAGTCKIVARAGTSATPVTVVDNVGTGC